MQFKYPELLWALALLLIPIIIHLFQLRRFQKTPFTNVKLLQSIVSQTRKSKSLKKWLLLISRMLLFASIIFAFAQPYISAKIGDVRTETVVYIDDSFSMQAKTDNGDLLQIAIQDLIRKLPPNEVISLFTNQRTFEQITIADIQNELLSLNHTYKQLSMEEAILKAQSLFRGSSETRKQLVAISDFQSKMFDLAEMPDQLELHLVQLRPEEMINISVDSVFIGNSSPTQLELMAYLSSSEEVENTPVSIWNADTLIAKTAARFSDQGKAEVNFSLPSDMTIDGLIEIADQGLHYDNELYFNINEKDKIKAMVIGEDEDDFLKRIFTEEEFVLKSFQVNNLNYSEIDNQNLIVINQLTSVPVSLQNALRSFTEQGGSLVVIPAADADINSYNRLISSYYSTSFTEFSTNEQQITSISFDHPLYKNVFEKSVSNFQYPSVSSYYKIRTNAAVVLRMQNGDPFLIGNQGVYIFTTSIDLQNSNFRNSPLIVPTFYNMGAQSLQLPSLYHPLSSNTKIDIPISLPNDVIAKVTQENYEFIPLQQSYPNKTTLNFEEHPSRDGIFDIVLGDSLISRISFNYPRDESILSYADPGQDQYASFSDSIVELLDRIENNKRVNELWPWFVILALLFALIEVMVQKLIK